MSTYIVEEAEKITSSTLLLTLQRDEAERPLAFQPGQYAAIAYEKHGKPSVARCFSVVSSPTDQHVLQFSMRVRGRYTTALSRLQKGELVDVYGPYGGFIFDADRDKTAVFIAGGIGITPFMCMLRYLSALNARNDVTLLYSCATQDDVPFRDELLAIQSKHPNLKTIFVVGSGPTSSLPAKQVQTGRVTTELLDDVTGKHYQDRRFFICGPPVFMKAMTNMLAKQGAPKSGLLTEAFTQSSPRQTSILRSWPANAYALGTIGVVLGGFVVMVSDLLRSLPPTTTERPTKTAPYLITNARQQQLDQLVNSIPPSPDVITAPTTPEATTPAPSSNTSTQSTTNPQPQTLSPIYTASISAPAPACQTTPSGRCI
ncbi:MAG TPA: FAD-dependent oxidoreductase [Candidatus Saccharimonadales bacterium]|nr:FAD-dependent oxidoreductase [Candidatus Saccharimonadales bacterium]